MTFGNSSKPTSDQYHKEHQSQKTEGAPIFDWVNMPSGEVFYNDLTSVYCIVMDAEKNAKHPIPLSSGEKYIVDQNPDARAKGFEAFIELWKNQYPGQPDPSKYINIGQMILDYIFYVSGFEVARRPRLPSKYLFSIKESDLDAALMEVIQKHEETSTEEESESSQQEQETATEEQETSESGSMSRPQNKKPETGSYVVFEADQLESIINNLTDALLVIGKDYECAYRNGTYNIPNLRFGKKISKVEKFYSKLLDIMQKSNVKISDIEMLSLRKATYGEVEKADEVWCFWAGVGWEMLEAGTSKMHKKDPFNDALIVNFIFNAPEISLNFRSAEPLTYDQFITKYFISLPDTKAIDPIQGAKSLLGGFGSSGTGAAACAANFAGSFLETVPGNEVSGQLTKYSDCLENKYPEKVYSTKEKMDLERVINDPILLNRRVQDAMNTRVEDMDPFINELKERIDSSKSLDELYIRVINPLGADGIAKLLAEGALLQLKCLTLDVAIKQICISALQSTISTQIYELYLNTVVTRQNSKLILSGDFAMMWSQLYGADYLMPTEDEIRPLSYTPPPNFDITKKKTAFVIGVPSVKVNNPLIADSRQTFVELVKQDIVSPYDLLQELLTNTAFADTSENSMLVAGITGMKDSLQLKAKVGKIKPLSMPYIPPIIIPNLGDLTKVAIDFAEEALKRVATEIAKSLMIRLLDAVFGYCDDPLAAQNIIGSSPAAMMNILKNEVCSPNATPDEVSQTVKSLLDSFSVWETSNQDSIPNSGDVHELMEATSEVMSPQEMIDVLNGSASDATYANLREAVNSMSSDRMKNALSSESSIENMFACLGTLVNRNALQLIKDNERTLNTPTNTTICSDPFQVVAADNATIQALAAKGLSDDEIDNQLKQATDRALARIDDTVKNLLKSGNLAEMAGSRALKMNEDGSLKTMSDDPTKPDEGVFPLTDASTSNYNSWMFNDIFDGLDGSVIDDMMIGNSNNFFNKGFLDMALSSTKGRGYLKITDEFYAPNDEGVLEFRDDLKAAAVPNWISNLYQGSETEDMSVRSGYDLRASNNQIVGDYAETETIEKEQDDGKTVTSDLSTKISTTIYNIGSNLKVETQGNTENISIYRKTPQEVRDYINEISPQSSTPNQILGNWCKFVMDDYLPIRQDTADLRENFIDALGTYVTNNMYSDIIQIALDQYTDLITENTESWAYGRGDAETKIVDMDEKEYGKGSFYVQTCKRDYFGWMKIYNNAIPIAIDGRDQLPLFNFSDIKRDCDEFYNNFPIDSRIQTTALVFKKYKEPPFARINNRINNAVLAGLTKATARVHIYDSLIKGTPAFKVYKMSGDNYGDVLSSYICDRILKEVLEESMQVTAFELRPMGMKGYYYIFLEQLVQSYSNMVNSGLFQPSREASDSLRALTEKIQNWNGLPPRIEKMKDLIDESLPNIKIILSDIVKEQLDKVGQNTEYTYTPKYESLVENIMNQWLFGGLNPQAAAHADGPIPIATSMTDADQYPTRDLKAPYLPFILEKYIKLEDEDGNIKIINPSELTDEILSLYENKLIGTRISLYLPEDPFSKLNLDSETQKYAKNILTEKFDDQRSFLITPSLQSEAPRMLVPLFSLEREANLQDLTTNMAYQSLAKEMIETPEFKTLFEKCIPMKDILSFVTIYTIENFIDSLGVQNRDKGFSAFSLWDGDTFQVTKKFLRKMTQQSYYGRDTEYINQINSDMIKPYLDAASAMGLGLAERGLDELLKTLPKWKRKKRRPMPPGVDPCEGT